MLNKFLLPLLALTASAGAWGADVSYRMDIQPLFQNRCNACHGAASPYLAEFLAEEKKFREQSKGPRMDSYPALISFAGWPDSGALMRRLDDGTNTADKKPGNMYQFLGNSDEERQAKLALFKAWIGEEAWNLKRWEKRGNVPAITKEEIDKLKLKY